MLTGVRNSGILIWYWACRVLAATVYEGCSLLTMLAESVGSGNERYLITHPIYYITAAGLKTFSFVIVGNGNRMITIHISNTISRERKYRM